MPVSCHVYPMLYETLLDVAGADNQLDWSADDIRLALFTSSYTPSDADQYYEALSGEVGAGGGYTTGGQLLAGKTVTKLNDSALGGFTQASAWSANTEYKLGQIVRAVTPDGHLYVCVQAGMSHATTEPVWDTHSREEAPTDGSCQWAEAGRAATLFDSNLVQWTSSTITARYAVGYKDGTTNNPLLFLMDFGQNESSSSSTFTVTPPADGWMRWFSVFSY